MMFELDNTQRKYFGLDPVLDSWDRVLLKGGKRGLDSVLYYEKETIKKHVISTEQLYTEKPCDDLVLNRELLLPKTAKGRPQKLSSSALASRSAIGVYLYVNYTGILIGNYTTQNTFYSSSWEYRQHEPDIKKWITEFIALSPENHFSEIEEFRFAKRKNVRYKAGDVFSYKMNRNEYGYGIILFNVHKARKEKLLPDHHGFNMIMGPPLLVRLFAYKTDYKCTDLGLIVKQMFLPSNYIMDNVVLYGEFEIIGNISLDANDIDFPISYGRRCDQIPHVFLQWGMIHRELPMSEYDNHLSAVNERIPENNNSRKMINPYSNYGTGFRPKYDSIDIVAAIENRTTFDNFKLNWDLRNPKNEMIRNEIMKRFGLDPDKTYSENCQITNTPNILV